ncbi:sigma-E processing peptidase SpoIIGA [Clostridium tetanomorphum]|uniref:Sporulation sigma-E factor-processing peptidase n=1 Tax=Clostridium tetanomorphum TaxID=1553 RepID=A0A923E9X7_CLOTT|nr:sigma-E processing peptidase SpoIIGA [Clostridium tetanomorphum]MBC2399178.1 sigma-E processing peptidase SpoIIGA [Clostridium tetanomorphum]NRZ98030.1 stage II sporulation protein GA (sporulation sigma-E factor processing peptidase) [Clostridium tetanomorphum]
MIVYIDLLLIENFIVNKFLLIITSQTVRRNSKTKGIYTSLAAFIGSFYVLTIIIDRLKCFNNIFMKLVVAIFMILISFRQKNLLFNIKASIIFVFYSMLLAGICVFIEFSKSDSLNGGVIYNFSYKRLMLSIMIIYILINKIILFIKDRKEICNFIYEVDIVLKDSKKSVKAFLDTGNELIEPITSLPVIVVEKDLFDEDELKGYDTYYIPYSVINGKIGRMKGIKPECIKLHKENHLEERDVLIAFCDNKLSSTGDYEALLSRGII